MDLWIDRSFFLVSPCVFQCGDPNEKCPPILRHLYTWSLASGIAWWGSCGAALLEEVWEKALRVERPPLLHLLSLLCACGSICELPAPTPMPVACCHASPSWWCLYNLWAKINFPLSKLSWSSCLIYSNRKVTNIPRLALNSKPS